MKYQLKCKFCGATCWARGEEDSDTNSTTIDDSQELEWSEEGWKCDHDEYEIIDSEDDYTGE